MILKPSLNYQRYLQPVILIVSATNRLDWDASILKYWTCFGSPAGSTWILWKVSIHLLKNNTCHFKFNIWIVTYSRTTREEGTRPLLKLCRRWIAGYVLSTSQTSCAETQELSEHSASHPIKSKLGKRCCMSRFLYKDRIWVEVKFSYTYIRNTGISSGSCSWNIAFVCSNMASRGNLSCSADNE